MRILSATIAILVWACAAAESGPDQSNAGAAGVMPVAGASTGGVSGSGSGGMAAVATGGAAGVAGATAGGSGGVSGMDGMGTGGAAGVGTGGMMGTTGGTGGTATPGTVTIELTTVSYDGEYAPRNYGAVWFEKADGTFVKTVKRWAGVLHATDLVAWTAASGGWGWVFGGGNMADMVDATSSATILAHEMHTVTWNMMDSVPATVADGEYVAVLEMSESRAGDREGPLLRIPFTKGTSPQTVEPPDQEGFTGVVLRYEP